jgi:predicted nucleic acid-binding protein
VWEEAERGETLLLTSMLSLVEVFKAKSEKAKPLALADDAKILEMLTQKWVERAVLDRPIAMLAREYMRKYPECKKPTDGIHLATASYLNADELHTFDSSDLLSISGTIQRRDGQPLTICVPKPLPPPPPPDPTQQVLFTGK